MDGSLRELKAYAEKVRLELDPKPASCCWSPASMSFNDELYSLQTSQNPIASNGGRFRKKTIVANKMTKCKNTGVIVFEFFALWLLLFVELLIATNLMNL